MKKLMGCIILALLMLPSANAYAHAIHVLPRTESYFITQSVNHVGDKVYCGVAIKAPDQEIKATMEFWCGKERLAKWSMEGYLSLVGEGRSVIEKDQTLTIVVSGTIEGKDFSRVIKQIGEEK